MLRPAVRYAKTGDGVAIAYSVVGEGSTTFVVIPQLVGQLEVAWEEPSFESFVSRLAAGARVVIFDRRGTGLSDHTTASGERLDLPQLAADVEAVLDASDTGRAVLVGASLGAMVAVQAAVTFPDRCAAVVLIGGSATYLRSAGYDLGVTSDAFDAEVDEAVRRWGTGVSFLADLEVAGNKPRLVEWAARLERHTCSPGMVAATLRRAAGYDIRGLLSGLTVPTLVLHREGDRVAPVDDGRYLARHVPGATLVELPGVEHTFFLGEQGPVLDAIRRFVDERVAGGRLRAALRQAERRNAYGYGWEALTGPEQEVAALVARGMTNSQIAERLSMSPYTVDGRLRKVFAKLDVSSRVELASEYARIGY
jgi:pimeloyl-ACP methyl ester carboxylesterase/DNA-binding CsgD family transcriptional regulator